MTAIRNVWEDCRQAVLATLVGLRLPAAMPDSETPSVGLLPVYEGLRTPLELLTFPCLAVYVEKLQPSNPTPAASTLVEIEWPIGIALLDRHAAKTAARVPPYADLLGRVAAAFRGQRLAGVPSVWQCRVENLPAFDAADDAYEFVRSGLVVRCLSREPVGGIPA